MGETAPYNMKHPIQHQEDDDDDNRSRDSSSSSSSTGCGLHSYSHNYTGCSSSTTWLNTDLSLGLTLSSSSSTRLVSYESDTRQGNTYDEEGADSSLMVKVYMEGIPIGRKLDLMTQHGYHTLLPTLSIMFNTPLFCPNVNKKGISGGKHVLTYEDSDGDWMLVGDVPWEMFLRTVKKLRITKSQTC